MAALEEVTREVGTRGYSYKITKLPTKKGLALFVRLIKVFGPVIGALLSTIKPKPEEEKPKPIPREKGEAPKPEPKRATPKKLTMADLDGEGLHRALVELAARLTESDLDEARKVFGEYTEVFHEEDPDKSPKLTVAHQEFHFAGEYGELFAWLATCLEVNYKGFFSGLPIESVIAAAGAATQPAETATPTASSPSESPQG